MKKLLLALAISALTIQSGLVSANDNSKVILDDDGNRPVVSSYDGKTKIVHIPLVSFKGAPAFSDVLLKMRDDGLFEFVDIRDYDESTDLVVPEVIEKIVEKRIEVPVEKIVEKIIEVPVDKIVYKDVVKYVDKIVYKDRIVYQDKVVYVSSPILKSKVDGTFDGWEGDTIVELTNGQIWQQDGFEFNFTFKFSPNVMIVKDGMYYRMMIEGVDVNDFGVRVKRIK